MIPKDGINLQYLKAVFLRRFWYIVLPFFMVCIATVGYCIKAPRVYKAETLILVEPQKVPSDYVRSTVSTDIGDRLRTIVEQVKSRTKLEKLINEYDLYTTIRAERTMTDAVEAFRKKIEIVVKRPGGRNSSASFEIGFLNDDPKKSRDVTNAIANLFIEDNLKLREAQAIGTTRFLNRELERMQQGLRQKETSLREFKEKYMGLLPEHMDKNYRMMSHLQRQLDSINATIQQTKDRKVLLESQLNNLQRMESQFGNFQGGFPDMSETGDSGYTDGMTSSTIEELRSNIEKLKLRYSDKHPDVIKLQVAITKLEKEQEADTSEADPDVGTIDDTNSEELAALQDVSLFDAQRQDLLVQTQLIDSEIDKLEKEKKKIETGMATYAGRIEKAPQIEQMLIDLSRGYDEASANYESLLQKKMQAQLAENLERAQQGEQFTVLDPAKLPEKPFKPDPRKILALGFIMAIACGLGLAFLREYLDPTFWSSKDLESVVELPVLVSVPVVNTKPERRWNLLKKAAAAGAVVSMASVLLYALFLLWKTDPTAFPFPVG